MPFNQVLSLLASYVACVPESNALSVMAIVTDCVPLSVAPPPDTVFIAIIAVSLFSKSVSGVGLKVVVPFVLPALIVIDDRFS